MGRNTYSLIQILSLVMVVFCIYPLLGCTADTVHEIQMRGTLGWKLVFSYDNTENSGSITVTSTLERTKSYRSTRFMSALNKSSQRYIEDNRISVDRKASFDLVSTSVYRSCQYLSEIDEMLEYVETYRSEGVYETREQEERQYVVGPHSKLFLYQRYFSADGIYRDLNVYATFSANDTTKNQREEIIMDMTVQPIKWLAGFEVRFGDDAGQRPASYIREFRGANEDINAGFGGKWTWLQPVYTMDESLAITSIQLIIQETAERNWPDLAWGTGGAYRYLIPVKADNARHRITDIALLRSAHALSLDPEWGYQGMSADINDGRGGDYLYLLWKSRPSMSKL